MNCLYPKDLVISSATTERAFFTLSRAILLLSTAVLRPEIKEIGQRVQYSVPFVGGWKFLWQRRQGFICVLWYFLLVFHFSFGDVGYRR